MHSPASEPFTKLSSNITDSSLWDLPSDVVKLWITMLAMADRYGYVGASLPGLAHRARLSMAIVEDALRLFMSPDPHSRSQEHEGRRVERADRGWLILNYAKYRGTDDEDRTRERKRGWWARNRGKGQAVEPDAIGNTNAVTEASHDTTLDALDVTRRLVSVSVSSSPSGSDLDPDPDLDLTRAREAEVKPPPSWKRPVLRHGQPLVHWTLEGWELSPELRAEAVAAGVPADEIDGYVEGLRAGPIGGSRGIIDRDAYVRGQFGRWRTWSETARHKRQRATWGQKDVPNQPSYGMTGLEIFDIPPRRALA